MKPVVPGGNDNFFPPVPPDEPVINFTKYFPKYGVILLLQETSEQELNDLSSELPSDTHRVTFRYPSGAVSTDAVRSHSMGCLLYTSPSPRDLSTSRMPSSA